MNSVIWADSKYDLEQAVAHRKPDDLSALEEYIEQNRRAVLLTWKSEQYTELSQRLDLERKKIHWACSSVPDADRVFFSIGRYEGYVTLLKDLLAYEFEKQALEQTRDGQLAANLSIPHFDEILFQLYALPEGIRHGKLAQLLKLDPSTLTGIMKKIVQAEAAEFRMIGKFKYYYLTASGKRYCARNQSQRDTRKSTDELIQMILSRGEDAEAFPEFLGKLVAALASKATVPKRAPESGIDRILGTEQLKRVVLHNDMTNQSINIPVAQAYYRFDKKEMLINTTSESTDGGGRTDSEGLVS